MPNKDRAKMLSMILYKQTVARFISSGMFLLGGVFLGDQNIDFGTYNQIVTGIMALIAAGFAAYGGVPKSDKNNAGS